MKPMNLKNVIEMKETQATKRQVIIQMSTQPRWDLEYRIGFKST